MNASPQSRADASRLCLYPWQLQPSSPDWAQEESALFAGEKLQIYNPIVLRIDSVWLILPTDKSEGFLKSPKSDF
ncbi:hypothetical protein [Phormidium sp. CCY1219]|uniref:hypothetical protein n=1 Tax=Phormidium sp. CCY1219 TaxID=2886104 RepID=UPI002D1EC6BE|nr:hypothetical protein [Phormidium sp. CCY1219]MEB3827274.1 hypothetical protein [Phormidium sp. CCY1219]